VPRYPRISLNGVYQRDSPLADDLALCKAVGLDWLAVPNWKFAQLGVQDSIALLNADPVGVSTICHANLFTLDDRTMWPKQLASAKRTIDIAAAVAARSVYLTTGSRGSLNWAEAADEFVDGVSELVVYAADQGMPLLVEPTASFLAELSMLHTLGDLVDVCQRSGLGVCLDVFACWSDSTYGTAMDAALERCGLVQLSDYANGDEIARDRAVPGDGEADWNTLFAAVAASGYDGLFDLELRGPRISAEGEVAAFSRAAEWTRGQLIRHRIEIE
jgi:sugar phosphate isomerase/epimerase